MELFLKALIWAGLMAWGVVALRKGRLTTPRFQPQTWLWIITAAYGLAFFYYGLARHMGFQSSAFDLSVYLQAFATKGLYSSILGKRLLADHFSPFLLILAPIFKHMPSPVGTLLLQAVLASAPAVVLFAFARRLGLGDRSSLLMAFVYLNFFGTRQLAAADLRAESYAPLFIMLLLYGYAAGIHWLYGLMMLLTVSLKEDMGFYLAAWAVIIVMLKDRRWLMGSLTAAAGVVAGVTAVAVLVASNKGAYPYFAYWSEYGSGLLGILAGSLLHPVQALGVFFQPAALKLLLLLALLPFLTLWGAALLPVLWVQAASQHPAQSQLLLYYSAPVLPFAFAALAAGWARLRERLAGSSARDLVLLGLGAYLAAFNLQPWPTVEFTSEQRALDALLRKIPANGVVLAQASAAPHISFPQRVRVLGVNEPKPLPDYVVYHIKGNIWPFARDVYLRSLNNMRFNSNYQVWQERDGAVIFRKK